MSSECAWILFFSAVLSMSQHPGAGTRGHSALSLLECARLADEALVLLRERYPEV